MLSNAKLLKIRIFPMDPAKYLVPDHQSCPMYKPARVNTFRADPVAQV